MSDARVPLAPRANSAIAALQKLADPMSARLDQPQTEKEFARRWLLNAMSTEFLRFVIEDDYIDADEEQPAFSRALKELQKRNDWLNPRLVQALNLCRRVATKQSLSAEDVQVRTPALGGECRVRARIAPRDRRPFQVSSERRVFLSVLEESITDPGYASTLVSAFAERVRALQEELAVTSLCFIEKRDGPVGALGLVSSLVSELGLPASIYRTSHWSPRANFVGYQPSGNDRVALVYDLLVTGDGLRQAAEYLQKQHGATIVAAVVLFGYGEERKTIPIGKAGHTLRVEALGWYDPSLESEVEAIRQGEPRTEHIDLLARGGASSPAPSGRTGRPSVGQGGLQMNRSRKPIWKSSVYAYDAADLCGVTFESERDLERGLDLLWSDHVIGGAPRELVSGRTIVVPNEVIAGLRFHGVSFTTASVTSAGDLSSEELATLQREQGHH